MATWKTDWIAEANRVKRMDVKIGLKRPGEGFQNTTLTSGRIAYKENLGGTEAVLWPLEQGSRLRFIYSQIK